VAKRPVIAIVDDDESVREATMSLMRASGFAVEAFACAEDFLSSDLEHRASCLIADVHMPGMSGLDLLNHLAGSGNSILTVLITAYPNDALRMRALKAGVVGYLTKPFAEDDLLHCINMALERSTTGGP